MFNELNTVENFIRDTLCGQQPSPKHGRFGEAAGAYIPLGRNPKGVGWHYVPAIDLPRRINDVFIEKYLRESLIRLNPSIAEKPERADEVIYKLRAIILSVRSDGLIRANENFTSWLRGERSMPFGAGNEHIAVRLLDYEDLDQNQYIATTQYTFRAGAAERRPDLMLFINGIPLVLIEAKTPVRHAVSWFDGVVQVHDDYERFVPELFTPNIFSVATEGKDLRYGAIHAPIDKWGPWRSIDSLPTSGEGLGKGAGARVTQGLLAVQKTFASLLRPTVLLDILAHFTLFATDKQKRRLKLVARYQQYEGANQIVQRVLAGAPRKGLIWHFQGSGKSLLMVFAAQKLRLQPALKNPAVLIVVDRVDLDSQISATFHASDIPNLIKADSRKELETLLRQDTRKIIITTIFKFGEADGILNERENLVLLVDEAHRTQEGDLGMKMRAALPNAFFFGLTGTPINRRDRNTFYAFGAEEDERGYMNRYGFEESIRDGATLPLHFEPRLVELHIDKDSIDRAYAELTGGLNDLDREQLSKAAAKMKVLVKVPDRIEKICADIAHHFLTKVRPNGFKAMVVTYDRESCLLYKEQLDKYLPATASDIVISVSTQDRDDKRYKALKRDRDAEEKLLDRFRDSNDPLEILVVTAKLLTGFDAPILQAMYLDKPMRDHTLLQAITRTNRTYGSQKSHGLIVDYLGIFDDVAKSLEFDEAGFRQVVSDIFGLKSKLPEAIQKALTYFIGVDRSLEGYEGLIAAQECLPNNEVRDSFAEDYSYLSKLWEAISPDPILSAFEEDYRWLSQVYISVQPTTGTGGLIWHSLGAKTIELIHQNIHVEAVRDDLAEIILDADLLDAVLNAPNPDKKAKEMQIKVARRLRKHLGDPRFRKLSERLEQLKAQHEAGQLLSINFLKELLDLARDVVKTEKDEPQDTVADEDRALAALTALFDEVRNEETPIIVERVVEDIDEIVRLVRFDGWQATSAGEREVRKALRKTLFKYKLHTDKELFEKAYGYVREYY